MTMHMNGSRLKQINIIQQNLNKSLVATNAFLHHYPPQIADIICIQEPHIDHLGNTCANAGWTVVYPSTHLKNPSETHSTLLISRKIHPGAWTPVETNHPDVTAARISTQLGEILLFNVYNACLPQKSTAIETVKQVTDRARMALNGLVHLMVLGDFNRHYPAWEGEQNAHLFTRNQLDRSEEIINLMLTEDLELLLLRGTPTLKAFSTGNLTRPDNILATPQLANRTTKCNTEPENSPPKTDHYPICCTIDVQVEQFTPPTTKNFKEADWQTMRKILKSNLPEHIQKIRTKAQLDNQLEALYETILKTIQETVPDRRPTPYAKRWWNAELTEHRKRAKRKARQAYKYKYNLSHPAHEEYRKARNEYSQKIKDAKRRHWQDFLENLDAKTLWDANKYAKGPATDGGQARIPALDLPNGQKLDDNKGKSNAFFKAFFVKPNEDDSSLGSEENQEYPQPAFKWTSIKINEVHREIRRLAANKAPGPDEIPNSLFKHCAQELVPSLHNIFNATIDLEHYPKQWKQSKTVVIRKPGRHTYMVTKSYRPIALMNTMGKILSAIVARKLMAAVETLQLLPNSHFGGRPGRTTTDAIHYLVHLIKNAWRRGKVASALFLDIKAAFPSTVPKRLIHDLRTRCCTET